MRKIDFDDLIAYLTSNMIDLLSLEQEKKYYKKVLLYSDILHGTYDMMYFYKTKSASNKYIYFSYMQTIPMIQNKKNYPFNKYKFYVYDDEKECKKYGKFFKNSIITDIEKFRNE